MAPFPNQMKQQKFPLAGSTVRIIGGRWRGRKIPVVEAPGLRPTGNRLRETLFNWLGQDLGGVLALDAFSGTGALGFEALSRGAAKVVMLEKSPAVYRSLESTAQLLEANADIRCTDTLHFLATSPSTAFDLVFVDPPFDLDLWVDCLRLLEKGKWLNKDALVYVEMPRDMQLSAPANWLIHREKSTAEVRSCLFRTTSR